MERSTSNCLPSCPSGRTGEGRSRGGEDQAVPGHQGFKPEEMSFTDHRSIVLARKAMQYDA
jgi:hypothetical protein